MDNIKISTLILWLFYIINNPVEICRISQYIKELSNMGYLEVVNKTEIQLTDKGKDHLKRLINKL